MSAIWGHISFGKKECEIDSMASEYRRKCKLDKITEVHFKNALMGAGLQYINPEDCREEMPYIVDGGKTVIVADCILDNRDVLIEELTDDTNRQANPGELPSGALICKAYEKWHFDLAKHLKGLFSIAIFNSEEEKLFLCTDQCACRCLNYRVDGDGCTFSTLLSPFREVYKGLKENGQYIIDFLCLPGLLPNISATETPWEGVFLVEAGCSVIIDSKERSSAPVISRYYSPKSITVSHNIKKAKEQFLRTYSAAVKDAVRTDGKISMALSGGFDSASVAVWAAKELAKSGKKMDSYTYVPFYKEEVRKQNPAIYITDETEDVKSVVEMYPNIIPHFEDDGGEDFTTSLDELIDIMEIPFKAYVNLPTLLRIYKKAAASGSKVFLNGQCGNASVSYGKIDSAAMHLYNRKKMLSFRKYFGGYCKLSGIDRKKNAKDFLNYIKNAQNDEPDDFRKFISPFVDKKLANDYDLVNRNPEAVKALQASQARDKDIYSTELYLTPSFAYIGAMETKLGLYTGMVIRDATRDVGILDYCNSVPYEFFCYNGVPRYLIRGFMEEIIPRRIIYPIQKKGKQSADWLLRLNRNKEKVFEMIKNDLEAPLADTGFKYGKYLDAGMISEFGADKTEFVAEKESQYLDYFVALMAVKYAGYSS